MRHMNRKYCRHFPRAFIVCFMAMLMIITTMLSSVQVYADPADKWRPVEHLVIVSDCDWFLSDLKSAMHSEESIGNNNGRDEKEYNGQEGSDHRFVKWGDWDGLKSAVNSLSNDNENVAVAFWMGFDYVNDTTTFSHDNLVKVDDGAKQKSTRTVPLYDDDGKKMGEKIEEYDTDENQYHYEIQTETCHKKKAEVYAETLSSSKITDFLSDKKVKYYFVSLPPNKGYDEDDYTSTKRTTKQLDGSGKVVLDDKGNAKTKTETKSKSELYGYWADKWNGSLSSAGTVINIWDAAKESKLYFTNTTHGLGVEYQGSLTHGGGSGTDSGVWTDADENHGLDAEKTTEAKQGDKEYNEEEAKNSGSGAFVYYELTNESLQQLFHIVFNTIQNMNERPASGDAVSQSMYAITASLTSYVNSVLSSNADEAHKDHKILDTKTSGNAGALLGYGDKKNFDFTPYITQNKSNTSSMTAYDALTDGKLKNSLQYARYGKLLNEMGLDSYGVKHTSGFSLSRMFAGVLMYIGFAFSAFASKVFEIFIDVVILLNPFRFFTGTGGSFGTHLGENITAMDDKFLAGNGTTTGIVKKVVGSDAMKNITNLTSTWYNELTSWSWGFFIPIGIAFTIFMLFAYSKLFGKNNNPKKQSRLIKNMVMRIVFVAIGVPLCGLVYTGVLNNLDTVSETAKSPSAQIIASTFVDFGEWAKQLRLTPVEHGTFEISTEDDVSGVATTKTLFNLRRTALEINKKTGVVDSGIGSISSNTNTNATNDMSWSSNMVNNTGAMTETVSEQMQTLIKGYMSDNFYYPSDWSADVHDALTTKANESGSTYTTGRRAGGEEKKFDSDKYQGETTLYNMYDATNEVDDWMGRELDENTEIFNHNKKWKGFNLFDNGDEIASERGKKVTFKDSSSTLSSTKTGTFPKNRGGLSTVSMYNYLSSAFGSEGVTVYSNSSSTNMQTRYAHRSVNTIGSGALGILYFANSLAILLVISIIGVYYFVASMYSVLKKGLTILVNIPGMALGIMKSISTVIVTTLSVILEIVGLGFMYTIVSEMFVVFIQLLQNMIGPDGANIVDNVPAAAHTGSMMSSMFSSGKILYMNLVFTTIVLVVIGIVAFKYRRAFHRAFCFVQEKWFAHVLDEKAVAVLEEKKHGVRQPLNVPVPVCNFFRYMREFVAGVANVLYNHNTNLSHTMSV